MFVQSAFKSAGRLYKRGSKFKGDGRVADELKKKGLLAEKAPEKLGAVKPAPKSETKKERTARLAAEKKAATAKATADAKKGLS